MKIHGGFSRASAGFYKPSLATAFLVIIFVAILFAMRMLNSPQRHSQPAEVRYSDRYFELLNRASLNDAERAELELEICRFERDTLRFLKTKPLASYDAELSRYKRDCGKILPLEE